MSSEYIPLVSWETRLLDVLPVLAEPFHYTCKVASVNPNDYAPNTIGVDRFYVVDYTGKIYQITEIVDAPTQTIKIYDLTEDADEGPYLSENSFVYQTRNGINVLTQAQRKRLHPSAIDQIMNIENNIIGGNYFWDKAWGAARIYGGILTSNGDGTVAISAGKGFIKASDDTYEKVPTSETDAPISKNSYVEWNDVASLALTDEAYNFVYYDGVDGIMKATTDFYAISFYQDFTVGRVYRSGTTVTIRLCGTNVWNFNRRVQLFGEERFPVERARGMMIGNPSGLYISLTGGILWAELINRFSVNAFDSSGTDRFLRWYRNGSGGWTTVTNQSVIDNINYDNNSGTLAALTANRYGVHWVYVVHDSSVHVVYGQGDYTLTQATAATPLASIPGLLSAYGTLVGKIIVQKSSAAFYSVESPFTTRFNSSGVTDHSELSGLTTGDPHTQYALLSGRSGDILKIDELQEFTSANGVKIDGLYIKDTGINFEVGATTRVFKDGSNNLSFTDAVTGTKTLAELVGGGSMVYPGAGIPISLGTSWNPTSITPATGYLRYTGAAFEWKNETYLTALPNHNLIDATHHPVSGLTAGHFLKALTPTSYGFAAHGLTYSDVGAAASSHSHYGLLSGSDYSNAKYSFYTTAGEGLVVGDDYEYTSELSYEQLLVYSSDTLSGIRIQSGVNAGSKWGIGTGCSSIGETSLYIRQIGGTNFVFSTSGLLTIGAGLLPDSHDGAYLGTAALGFSDLYLATGAVITFGEASTPNMTLTHSADLLSFSKNISIVCGSDADGDIWYRSSGKFARLGKGTAGQVLKMGATAPEWGAASGGSVSFGTDYQIPFMKTTDDNFQYSSSFTWNGRRLTLKGYNNNLYIGSGAGPDADVGGASIILGSFAGANATGSGTGESVLIGYGSGTSITTGVGNTYIGHQTGLLNTTGSRNIFLGYRAGYYETDSDKLFIDNQSRTEATSRTSSLIYGEFNGTPASQLIRFNGQLQLPLITGTGTGTSILHFNRTTGAVTYADASTVSSVSFGTDYQIPFMKTTDDDFQYSSSFTWNGYSLGITDGNGNVMVGFETGRLNPGDNGGFYNTFVGYQAGYNTVVTDFNTYIGYKAGYTNESDGGNVFIGHESGYYETGSNKLFIDNQGRSSEANARISSLIYGEFNETPTSQLLRVNGVLDHSLVPNKPKIYTQATEPNIPNDTMAFWKDSDDNKYYLILDIGGTQKKVELT